ncbi:glycosyltransferase [Salinicola halophilus]|uniref:glycosyltransferase n=1 Tax=Salinicola halophilus TaxID=184065 RepID=UPI0013A5FF53|nr:glycosyltransferase [Salinicola halophilus]
MSDDVSNVGPAANDERVEGAPRFEANLDDHDCGVLIGWAWDRQRPEAALAIEVRDATGVLAVTRADGWRRDLVTAGKGNGRHGFEVRLDLAALASPTAIQLFEVGSVEPLLSVPYTLTLARGLRVTLGGIDWGRLVGEVAYEDVSAGEPVAADTPASVDERLATSRAVLIDAAGKIHARAAVTRDEADKWRFALTLPAALCSGEIQRLDVAVEGFPGAEARFVGVVPRRLGGVATLETGVDDESHVARRRYASLTRQLGRLTHRRQGAVKAMTTLHRAHQVLVNGWQGRRHFPTLSLTPERKPAVSVLLPAQGGLPRLYHTLASLALTAGTTPFEVLVIDMGERDTACASHVKGGSPWLARQAAAVCGNLRVVEALGTGERLATRVARSVDEALAEHVLWLEPGTELLEGALETLHATFSDFDQVGVVGASALEPDGRLRHAGAMVLRNGTWRRCGANEAPSLTAWSYVRRVDAALPGAVMFERRTWHSLDGVASVDEGWESLLVDLCLRAEERGWHTLHQPGAQLVALETSANARQAAPVSPSFVACWLERLSQRGVTGDEIAPVYRVLMIDAEIPRPDRSAGAYAAWQEMRLLQACGCQVSFVADSLEFADAYTRALERAGVRCFHAPEVRSLEALLREHGRDFDLIYITRFNVAEKHLAAIRQFSHARIVFNNADLHFLRELRLRLSAGDPDLSFPLAIRDRELAVMREADAVLCYSEAEQAVITSHNLRQDNLFRCPWVVEGRGARGGWSSRAGIAFLGGYRHRPNVEAVEHFVTQVMPMLREALPGVKLHLYGSDMPTSFQALASEDVVLEGYVEDVATLFDAHRLFIAPLLSGAGIKGKVLEAMSFGLPCVLTPIAAEGTGLVDGVSARIVQSPADWVAAIDELYADADRWQSLSESSLGVARTHFSFARGREQMRHILRGVGLEPPVTPRALCTRHAR